MHRIVGARTRKDDPFVGMIHARRGMIVANPFKWERQSRRGTVAKSLVVMMQRVDNIVWRRDRGGETLT